VSNWYRVGLALDLESYDLDIIGKDNQGDTKIQTLNCKMFQLWLTRQPQALYKQLIQALHEVGDEKVVTFLCRKYGEYHWYTYANLTRSTMIIVYTTNLSNRFNSGKSSGLRVFAVVFTV